MSGRLILLAAALLAGIMGGIGLWWVLAILLIWLVMKTNRTSFVYVGLFLVIGWVRKGRCQSMAESAATPW